MVARSSVKLAGFLAMSSYVPLSAWSDPIISEQNKAVPILMCHGDADPVVRKMVIGKKHSWHKGQALQHARLVLHPVFPEWCAA